MNEEYECNQIKAEKPGPVTKELFTLFEPQVPLTQVLPAVYYPPPLPTMDSHSMLTTFAS